MPKYEVGFTETLFRIVEIEARNEDEAIDKALQMHKDEEVVLDASDFVQVEVGIV